MRRVGAATDAKRRAGSVLLLTLIVVALLTLGAMAFFERTFAEHSASRAHGRQMQTRLLADSGVEYLKYLLAQDPAVLYESGGVYDNPDVMQGVLVLDDPLAAFRGRCTVLAPQLRPNGHYGGIRFGLEDESARLNLNTLLLADQYEEDGARQWLMALPGMTEPIADAILDWLDPDDEPRLLGAERDYYSSLDPPYEPRNGPLHSIEELLMVRDVTPALLFGADLNRNALVDVVEEPLKVIEGVDNSSGALNRGWAAYLTLDSAERNVRPDGQPKIDVNKDDLQELHQELAAALDDTMANFLVAYRQNGVYQGQEPPQSASGLQIDYSKPGPNKLTTLLDVVGVRTSIVPQGQEEPQVIEAAFSDEASAMRGYLPKLLNNLTVYSGPMVPGRLNINQAPRPLLRGLPGVNLDVVERIVADRDVEPSPQQPEQQHETWLLTYGIVDLETMKSLMPLVTAGGDVYRAQIVGFFDAEGPASRMEVVLDGTQTPAIVKRRRELIDQGPGYSPEVLGAATGNVP